MINADGATLLRDQLQAFVAHNKPEASHISIEGVARAGAGNSTENWAFDARWSEDGRETVHRFILRRAPENEVVLATRAHEFELLRALGPTVVPAPRAFWMDVEGRWLQRPGMVLERCEGAADRNLLTDRNKLGLSPARRLAIARRLPERLAEIHRLDVSALQLPTSLRRSEGAPAAGEMELQERQSRGHENEPSIELRLAAWWLHDNLPPAPARVVLLHGDFRPENMMVADGELSAILDWELAHVGDPLEDLGWYLAPNYRAEHLIAGVWDEEDFLACYEAAAGLPVDRAALAFWKVFAHYKLAGIALAIVNAFIKGDAGRLALPPKHLLGPMLRMIADPAPEGRR